MVAFRLVEKPAFTVIGKKTWISGQDNSLFARFWDECRQAGVFDVLGRMGGMSAGAQTGSTLLGVSCVADDPARRSFYYLIGIEKPDALDDATLSQSGLEAITVPASTWAVFECHGKIPDSIVNAEMFAFMQWLPASGYEHAAAPEMEVYFYTSDPTVDDSYCEFWLPVIPKAA